MKLSLILPTYNESGSITETLRLFSDYCLQHDVNHELIVVNDGSTDQTGGKVREFSIGHEHIHLIEHEMNRGYGAALRSGFSAATGDYIFFTDSDGQFKPDDLDHTLPLVDANTIVLGYRTERAEGFIRRLNAWLWNQCIRLTLGIRVRDLNCAWKLFPRTLLSDVTLTSQGAFINAEVLYYAKQKKLKFREIPVHHWPRQAGIPTGANPLVVMRALCELVGFIRYRMRSSVTP